MALLGQLVRRPAPDAWPLERPNMPNVCRCMQRACTGQKGPYNIELGILWHAPHAAELPSLKGSSQVDGPCVAKELAVPCQALGLCFTTNLSLLQGGRRVAWFQLQWQVDRHT